MKPEEIRTASSFSVYVLDRRTTDEQTNQTEEFVKVIPFPSQHLPSQHGELIHFLYCSNALN
jgi:hypothetical protein